MNISPLNRIYALAILGMVIMFCALAYGFIIGDFNREGAMLMDMPWGIISIIDVYIGILFFSVWMWWREKLTLVKIPYITLFICLGNLATALYVLKALFESNGEVDVFINGSRSEERV